MPESRGIAQGFSESSLFLEFGEQGEEWPKKMGVESRGWIYGNCQKNKNFYAREVKGKGGFI